MATVDLGPLVDRLRTEVRRRAAARHQGYRLGIVVEEGNASGASFARSLAREAAAAGVVVDQTEVCGDDPQAILLALDRLVVDPRVDGIVVMQPLSGLPPAVVAAHLPASKDVEAITPTARALAADGLHRGTPVAEACIETLSALGVDLARARILVVGHGPSGGRPIAQRLLAAGAQVSIVQREIAAVSPLPPYDVLVSAVGRADVIPTEAVAPGSVVLDVGTSFVGGRLVGDVGAAAAARARLATPVPGGIGRVTAVCALLALTELRRHPPGPVASWSLLETAARIASPADPAGGAALGAMTGALSAALDGLCRMHEPPEAIADSGALAVRLLLAADRDRAAFAAYRRASRLQQGAEQARAEAARTPAEIADLLAEVVRRLSQLTTTDALDVDRVLGLRLAEAARDAVRQLPLDVASPTG